MMYDDEEDGEPKLGLHDVAVLTAIVKIPEEGGKLSLKTITEFTGLPAREVFDILTFLVEYDFITESVLQ